MRAQKVACVRVRVREALNRTGLKKAVRRRNRLINEKEREEREERRER